MRQWELIGITDQVPMMTQPVPRPAPRVAMDPTDRRARVLLDDGRRASTAERERRRRIGDRPVRRRVQGARPAGDLRAGGAERVAPGCAHPCARGRRRDVRAEGGSGQRPLPSRPRHRRAREDVGDVLRRDAHRRRRRPRGMPSGPPSPETGQPANDAAASSVSSVVGVVVCGAEAPQLVAGRRQVDAAVQHVMEEARVSLVVGGLRVLEVPHRAIREEHAEHRPARFTAAAMPAAANRSARPSVSSMARRSSASYGRSRSARSSAAIPAATATGFPLSVPGLVDGTRSARAAPSRPGVRRTPRTGTRHP